MSDYVDKGIPFYRSKEIIELSNNKPISGPLFISEVKYKDIKSKFPVPEVNDILITSVGTIGVTYLVRDSNFYFKDGNLTWLRNVKKNLVDVNYLFKWLKSKHFKDQILNNNIGAVQKAITIDYLKKVNIPLPALTTQKSIAKVLADLDAKIELNNKVNAELEAMAKLIYDYWFVQFEFPTEDSKPYKSSGGKMVWNEELKRMVPEGWEVEKLSKCCEIIDCLHSKKSDFVFEDEKYYLLQLENISDDGLIDLTSKYYVTKDEYTRWTARIEVKDHDLVITNAGRVAGLSQIPKNVFAGIGRNITAIRPKNILPTFLYYSFQGTEMKRQIKLNTDTGSFFQSLNVRGIKELLIVRSPKSLEEKFENTTIKNRRKRESNIVENQKLTELRDWLLPMLMNGQVKVN